MLSYENIFTMFCGALVAAGRNCAVVAFQSPHNRAAATRRVLLLRPKQSSSPLGLEPHVVAPAQQTRPYRRSSYLFSKKLEGEVGTTTACSAGKTTTSSSSSTANYDDDGILRVVKYPHPALRAPNAEITKEELKKNGSIAQLAKDMFASMYEEEGVGLAAPQVGVNKRLMVYNQSGDKRRWLDEIVMINPKIVEFSEAKDTDIEGCLSFPDMSGEVERSKWIKVEALNLKGKKIKRKFTGWEARIFQHEYDHLDQVVYIDRLSEKGREEVQPRLNELIEEFGEGGVP